MQPETPTAATTPTPADCRALRAELLVTNTELRERTVTPARPDGYPVTRIARVLNGAEASQPLVDAVYAALVEIRVERLQRRAAAGDRQAMDALDSEARRGDERRPSPIHK